jgi:hypothetical protein
MYYPKKKVITNNLYLILLVIISVACAPINTYTSIQNVRSNPTKKPIIVSQKENRVNLKSSYITNNTLNLEIMRVVYCRTITTQSMIADLITTKTLTDDSIRFQQVIGGMSLGAVAIGSFAIATKCTTEEGHEECSNSDRQTKGAFVIGTGIIMGGWVIGNAINAKDLHKRITADPKVERTEYKVCKTDPLANVVVHLSVTKQSTLIASTNNKGMVAFDLSTINIPDNTFIASVLVEGVYFSIDISGLQLLKQRKIDREREIEQQKFDFLKKARQEQEDELAANRIHQEQEDKIIKEEMRKAAETYQKSLIKQAQAQEIAKRQRQLPQTSREKLQSNDK